MADLLPTQGLLTPAWTQLRYHPTQSALWRSRERFVLVSAGRRSGKTDLARRRLVRYLPIPRGHRAVHMYAYLMPTQRQAKRYHWQLLKSLVPRQWLEGLPLESDMVIRVAMLYRDGLHKAELHLIGMDKPQRFEGSPWDGVVKDESSDHRNKVFANTIRPALADRLGWCWEIGAPKRYGSSAFEYRNRCQLGFSGDDVNTKTFTWPSWDILPSSEVGQLQATMDEKDYLEQIGGAWQNMGGAAFHGFDKDSHVRECHYDPTKTVLVGCDFNVDPMGWVLCHLTDDGQGLEVFDELFLTNTNTPRSLDTLWNRYGEKHKGGWWFYGDAASSQRHTSASQSDYAHIKNDQRFKARVSFPASNPGRRDRAASCNALLRNAAGRVRCWIDPRCVHVLADLENRGLDKDGCPSEGKSGEPIGHISDGWGYLVHAKWPCTRIEPSKAGQIGIFQSE